MCGPALPIAATVVTMAGQVTQGVGQARQAGYESKVAKMNAGYESERARIASIRGEERVRVFQGQAGQERGAMRASMAANGIDVAYGSAADVLGDQAQNAAEDSRAIMEEAQQEVVGFRQRASNQMAEAAAAKSRRRGAIVGTAFNVASTALGTASQIGKIKQDRERV